MSSGSKMPLLLTPYLSKSLFFSLVFQFSSVVAPVSSCHPGKTCINHVIDSGIMVQGNQLVPTETVTTKFNLHLLESNPSFKAIKSFEHLHSFANCFLFTRSNPEASHLLTPGNIPLLKTSSFNPLIHTKIIIHGFSDNMYESNWMMRMKDNMLAKGNWNIILVDWSCCNELPYAQAVSNAPVVAEGVKDLMLFLQLVSGATMESFHLIGHCLGSHIAGIAGRGIKKLGRITALNPLGPSALGVMPMQRLSYNDALFVDCIHTAGPEGITAGVATPIGHVDFFPNGGGAQPGCELAPTIVVTDSGNVINAKRYMTCDHFRATVYFMESITRNNSCTSVGVSCKDYNSFNSGLCGSCAGTDDCYPMGLPCGPYILKHGTPKVRKNVYLKTSATSPYCVFQSKVLLEKKEHSSSPIQLQLEVAGNYTVPVVLPGKDPEILDSSGQPVFLVVTKKPINTVHNAKILLSPNMEINLHRIHFLPIMLPESAGIASTVLCLPSIESVKKNSFVSMKVNQC